MTTVREGSFYSFVYNDDTPACFAEIQVWAALKGGTGTVIPVFPIQQGTLRTDGEGFLLRVQRQPNWVNPEIRLFDRVADKNASFPFFASTYKLNWDRPAPFAEMGADKFNDVDKFLTFLVSKYQSLSAFRPAQLRFLLNRVGSPAMAIPADEIFRPFKKALDKANGNFLLDPNATDTNQEFEDEHLLPGRRVLWALSQFIPVGARTSGRHTQATMAEAYLQMLQRIATSRASLRLAKILDAVTGAIPHGLLGGEAVVNQLEDWVLAGLLVFLAGLNAFGYVVERFDEPDDPFMEIFSVTMALPKQ